MWLTWKQRKGNLVTVTLREAATERNKISRVNFDFELWFFLRVSAFPSKHGHISALAIPNVSVWISRVTATHTPVLLCGKVFFLIVREILNCNSIIRGDHTTNFVCTTAYAFSVCLPCHFVLFYRCRDLYEIILKICSFRMCLVSWE